MKCAKCPLFSSWNNESDKGESCGIFGDGWDNEFQYEDKHGTTIGCYIHPAYIKKRYDDYMKAIDAYCDYMDKQREMDGGEDYEILQI